MKHKLSKLTSLFLAVAMALAMAFTAVPAKAAGTNTITVNNAVKDESYSIYKMLDLKVNDAKTAFTYTVNSDWTNFFTTGAGKDYVTIDETDSHVTWVDTKKTEADMTAFGKAAKAYAEANKLSVVETKTAAVTTEGSKPSVVFDNLENGYYLITSTLGTVVMTETTPQSKAVSVTEKNPEDTIEKTVKEDSTNEYGKNNDAEVGQLVEFKSVATLNTHTRNVFIHDTMDNGLTFSGNDSIHIYTDEACTTPLDIANYTILTTPQSGDTFTIQIADSYADTVAQGTKLYITYTATLNENAIVTGTDGSRSITDQKNQTKITYGDKQTVTDETVTTTHKFSVFKYASGDETTHLAGAVFKVQNANGTDLKLVKIDNYNYRLAKSDDTNTVDTFTTVADGDIVIWGVDSDSYKLVETQAPAGYNALANPVSVVVDKANNTQQKVENKSGSTLPSTGGIGTTIFYVVGGILVAGAAILLITRRRTER